MIAGTRGGGVYFSDDNGMNWVFAGNGLPLGSYVNKLIISGNYIFAGTDYQQGVWKRPLSQLVNGIEEHGTKFSVNVFPNPVSEKLFVKTNADENKLFITDIAGRKIGARLSRLSESSRDFMVDVSELEQGIYFLSSGANSIAAKFIVAH